MSEFGLIIPLSTFQKLFAHTLSSPKTTEFSIKINNTNIDTKNAKTRREQISRVKVSTNSANDSKKNIFILSIDQMLLI